MEYEIIDVNHKDIFTRHARILGVCVAVPQLNTLCTYAITASRIPSVLCAKQCELPGDIGAIVTTFPSIFSVVSMAIIKIRLEKIRLSSNMQGRIRMIIKAERLKNKGYHSSKELPSKSSRWSKELVPAKNNYRLAVLLAVVKDNRLPLIERIEITQKWLLTGMESVQHRAFVEKKRQEIIDAIESGAIKTELFAGGKIVLVTTADIKGCIDIGYCLAPVVIMYNIAYIPPKISGVSSVRRFYIAFFNDRYADIKNIVDRLKVIEPGWHCRRTICEGPMFSDTILSVEQIVKIVQQNLY